MTNPETLLGFLCGWLLPHFWVYQNGVDAPVRRCKRCKVHQKYLRLYVYGSYVPGKWVRY